MLGVAIILGQDAFGWLGRLLPDSLRMLYEFIYPTGVEVKLGANGPGVAVLYVLVPWIGVMAAGYGFGAIVVRPPAERRRWCLRIGLTLTALFVVIAGAMVLMNPASGAPMPALFRMLNQRKYPASALFLAMTLGPLIALIPAADRARGWLADVVSTFGRVPMFYYLLHIPTIHLVALLVWYLRDGQVHPEWFAIAPFAQVPPPARWGLPLLYLVFAVVIALLYWPCRWFAARKARGGAGWLRFI